MHLQMIVQLWSFDLALLSLELSVRETCGMAPIQTGSSSEGYQSINAVKNEQG